MKFLLSISLLSFFLLSGFRRHSGKIVLLFTQNVTISRFHYQLSTMKWGDHFQVASGMRQAQTKNHIPYRVTSCRNGDDLVFFPDSQEYFFFYSGMATPDRCVVEEHYEYPVTQLPYYKKPAA